MAIIRVEDGNPDIEILNNVCCAFPSCLGVSFLEKLFSPVYIMQPFPLQLQMTGLSELVTQKKISLMAFQGNMIQRRVWSRGIKTEYRGMSTWSGGSCPLEIRSPLSALCLLKQRRVQIHLKIKGAQNDINSKCPDVRWVPCGAQLFSQSHILWHMTLFSH